MTSSASLGRTDQITVKNLVLGALITGLLTAAVFLLFVVAKFGTITEIDGARKISAVEICQMTEGRMDCDGGEVAPLPDLIPARGSADLVDRYFRVTVDIAELEHPLALYVPRVTRALSITVNEAQILPMPALEARQWNRAILVDVNDATLTGDQVTLELHLRGYGQEGVQIWPFFIGPSEMLSQRKILSDRIAVDLAVFAQGMMVLLLIGHLIVRRALQDEEVHLWLAASAFCAVVFLTHYAHPMPFIPYPIWTVIWTTAPALYVLFLMKFVLRYLELNFPFIERSFTWLIGVSFLFAITLMPPDYALLYGAGLNATNAIFGTFVLSAFWVKRKIMGSSTFLWFFPCFCVPLAMGLFEIILVLSPEPITPLNLFHMAPIFLASVAIFLFMSQLITAMQDNKSRALEMAEVAAKIQMELEQSYNSLAQERETTAIEKERSRILLDLHDGIGGILANTIAYIDNHGRGDAVIRDALEEAMRDLALMLDGLENSQSLATLLGMLRERLEPLMADQNLSFDWQVEQEPILPSQGPSHNLALARIVQEGITNTIKHAHATSIRIYTERDMVQISDNRQGFDAQTQTRNGYGLLGMKRRAKDLGIQIRIESGANGTEITLDWRDRAP